MAGKRGSFGVSLLSAAAFDHLLLAAKAIPLPEPVRSAILGSKPPGIWRMSVESALRRKDSCPKWSQSRPEIRYKEP